MKNDDEILLLQEEISFLQDEILFLQETIEVILIVCNEDRIKKFIINRSNEEAELWEIENEK